MAFPHAPYFADPLSNESMWVTAILLYIIDLIILDIIVMSVKVCIMCVLVSLELVS